MKSQLINGKTIAKIHQKYIHGKNLHNGGRGRWFIEAIEFTDGSFLRLNATETEYGESEVYGIYPAKSPSKMEAHLRSLMNSKN